LLHLVAVFTPYTLATCNKRAFSGGFTYENPLLQGCNKRPQKMASLLQAKSISLQPVARFVAGRFRQPNRNRRRAYRRGVFTGYKIARPPSTCRRLRSHEHPDKTAT
jgi:hypothetical protein